MPCTPLVHKYLRRWVNWTRIADIQAERAVNKKAAYKAKNRGGPIARRTGRRGR